MADLTKEDIQKLARLSKIALTDEEITKLQGELQSILAHVEQLQSIDTGNVQPTYQVTGLTNVTRIDEIKDYGVTRDDLLKNVPETSDGMIKVPKVL